MRCHATRRLLIIEPEYGIRRAPRLERPRLLQVFTLERQPRTTHAVNRRAGQNGCAVDPRLDPFTRERYVIKIGDTDNHLPDGDSAG
jgi:hypothetical protein